MDRETARQLKQEARLKKREEKARKKADKVARKEAKKAGQTKLSRSVNIPATISIAADLEELIRSLQALKAELAVYSDIEVTIKIES